MKIFVLLQLLSLNIDSSISLQTFYLPFYRTIFPNALQQSLNKRTTIKTLSQVYMSSSSPSNFFIKEIDDPDENNPSSPKSIKSIENEIECNDISNNVSSSKSYIRKIKVTNFAGMVGSFQNGLENEVCSEQGNNKNSIVIQLEPGLVAITGETGSGKSLLLNKAVSLAVGGKASGTFVKDYSDDDNSLQETIVEMEMKLSSKQCFKMKTLFEKFKLDPSTLIDSGTLKLTRILRRIPGKSRLQSACTINGQTITLRNLRTISSSIITIVDAPTASMALNKADSRIAILDQGVSPDLLSIVKKSAKEYQYAKEARIAIETEIQQRESFLPPSVRRSQEEINSGSMDYEDETLLLLQHWVDELDDFEKRMKQLQTQAENIVVSLNLENRSKRNSKMPSTISKENPLISPNAGTKNRSLHGAAKNMAESTWISDKEDSDDTFYSHLLDFREGVKGLDAQLEHAYSAHDNLISLSSSEGSVAIAIENARNHLYDVTSENSGGETSTMDPIFQSTERTHELLNELESILQKCAGSIDGQSNDGLINHLECMKQAMTITTDDIDLIITDWNTLARKHNISPYALPICHQSLRTELDGDTVARERLPKALEIEKQALQLFEESCQSLTKERAKVAKKLSGGVSDKMPQLGMERSKFHVQLNERTKEYSSPSAYSGDILGVDTVDFLLVDHNDVEFSSENSNIKNKDTEKCEKGHGKMEQVASSGERARILLAIETELPGSVGAACGNNGKSSSPSSSVPPNLSSNDNMIAVLYDEIDAHVGGRAAVAVARLLSSQSQMGCQVISITHSASVAAVANQHIVVERTSVLDEKGKNKMQIQAECVEGLARRQELARMASGDLAPAEAEKFAEALLKEGVLQRDSKTWMSP